MGPDGEGPVVRAVCCGGGSKPRRGVSVVELLVSLFLLALLLTLGINGVRAFFVQVETNRALRTVTSTMQSARYLAVDRKIPMKVRVEADACVLLEQEKKGWRTRRRVEVAGGVSLEANAQPVFYPTGFASPLCSVWVRGRNHTYRITLSICGRVKIHENR